MAGRKEICLVRVSLASGGGGGTLGRPGSESGI